MPASNSQNSFLSCSRLKSASLLERNFHKLFAEIRCGKIQGVAYDRQHKGCYIEFSVAFQIVPYPLKLEHILSLSFYSSKLHALIGTYKNMKPILF